MSFLTPDQLTTLSGTFARHFSQFSSGINNYATIFKEPLQNINNLDSQSLFGYSSDTTVNSNSDITYTEVSRSVPAMIIYGNDIKSLPFPQMKTDISSSDIFIKVDEAGKNYITNGKTERAQINGQIYDLSSTYKVQNYFGLKFYYFKCTERQ
jgi:hypothetical protein